MGPDFAKLAEAYGIVGITVTEKTQVAEAVRRAKDIDGPVLIDFQIEREHNVFPIVPVGKAIDEMIRRPKNAPACPQKSGRKPSNWRTVL